MKGRHSPRWTDEEILEALRAWTRFHGRTPSTRDLNRPPLADRRHHPTYSTVLVRFGSLENALRAAGLEAQPLRRWTQESIIAAIQEWARVHGVPPSNVDWQKATATTPSSETVRHYFGTLRAARRAAGLPGIFQRRNMENLTRDDVIAAIYRWRFLHGRLPRESDWRWPTEEWPGTATVRRLFGSWNGAIVVAGYTPRNARMKRQITPHGYRAIAAGVTKREAA